MEYRQLGQSELNVSAIGLGTMTFGEQNSERDAFQQLDFAVEQGVNFIDTAELYPVPPHQETYGATEQIIGGWLKQRRTRDRIVLASKAVGPGRHLKWIRNGDARLDAKNLKLAVDESLKRLNTDYLDLYQLHWPDRPCNFFGQLGYKPARNESFVDLTDTLRALADLVETGKIRHIGVSNETPWGIMSFLQQASLHRLPAIVSTQNPYNLLNRSLEVGLAEVLHREAVGLIAYSPLAFGRLTGKYYAGQQPPEARITKFDRFKRYSNEIGKIAADRYVDLANTHGLPPAQMAIAFLLQKQYVSSVLIGATNLEQLKINIASSTVTLDKEILKAIDKIHHDNANPCP